MNALVGGWNVSGILYYSSGLPLGFYSANWYRVWGGTIFANIDGSKRDDVSILKNFTITERVRLQLRAEFSDIFNRHYFNYPITDISSPPFGQVASASGLPRQGQLGVRVDW